MLAAGNGTKLKVKNPSLQHFFFSFEFSTLKFVTFFEMTVTQPQSTTSVQDSHPLGPGFLYLPWPEQQQRKATFSLTSEQHLVCVGIPTQLVHEVLEIITSHVSGRDMRMEVKRVMDLVAVPCLIFLVILECSLVKKFLSFITASASLQSMKNFSHDSL